MRATSYSLLRVGTLAPQGVSRRMGCRGPYPNPNPAPEVSGSQRRGPDFPRTVPGHWFTFPGPRRNQSVGFCDRGPTTDAWPGPSDVCEWPSSGPPWGVLHSRGASAPPSKMKFLPRNNTHVRRPRGGAIAAVPFPLAFPEAAASCSCCLCHQDTAGASSLGTPQLASSPSPTGKPESLRSVRRQCHLCLPNSNSP